MKQRKIILSRKGFDSEYGGRPSPILPDGTMLSLPIPDEDECTRYEDLFFEGVSYLNIISELGYNKNEVNCHLDPDLRFDATHRDYSWKACFGQSGAAASHLNSQNVGVGDIFLFFGWFRETEYDSNGKLRYVRKAPDIHAIFGYLQVGEIASTVEERAKFSWHPHAKKDIHNNGLNFIFVADENVLGSVHPGSGVFKFNNKLQLTKQGMSRSRWELPEWLTNIPMTYHNSNSLKENYFQSAMKGQEFVFDSSEKIEEWIMTIIKLDDKTCV